MKPKNASRRDSVLVGLYETMERRKHQRHDLGVPVRFEWGVSNRTYQGIGITRDLSAEGLFVMTADPPPVGTTVRCEVDIGTSTLASAVTVRAKGLVNRVELTDLTNGLRGFAISTRRMMLEKPET